MTSLNNYSKWDHIQLSSDDDEDCHPNIEKFTWRRLRKQQREAKRDEEDKEAERIQAQIKALQQKIKDLEKQPQNAITASHISRHTNEANKLKEYLEKREQLRKLSPDEMCQETFDSTRVNKNAAIEHVTPPALQKKIQQDREVDPNEFQSWHKKYDGLLQEYLKLSGMEACRDFVLSHPEMLNANATGWLLLHALEKEMGGDSAAMIDTVRHNQFLQYPIDLAKLSNVSVASAAKSFFSRIAGPQQRAVFENDVQEFALKIKERAVEKRKEQLGRAGQQGPELPSFREGDTEYQVLSKSERMGPGGLDPLEVLETLPPAMKEAFMKQDTPALANAIAEMPRDKAEFYMDQARKSGLWVDQSPTEDVSNATVAAGGGSDEKGFGTKVAYQ